MPWRDRRTCVIFIALLMPAMAAGLTQIAASLRADLSHVVTREDLGASVFDHSLRITIVVTIDEMFQGMMTLQGMTPKIVKVMLLHLSVCLVCSPAIVADAI